MANYLDKTGVTKIFELIHGNYALSDHDHDGVYLPVTTKYAESSSVGGAATSANKVNTNLTIKLNSGTTEGTNLFTFNGSADKTINITPGGIGAAPSSHSHSFASITDKITNDNELNFVPEAGLSRIYINYKADSGDFVATPTNTFIFCDGTGVDKASLQAYSYIVEGGTSSQFLKGDGSLDSNSYALSDHTHSYATSDTKNTAGSTNDTTSKLYLIGATSQAANPQTYSNSSCYISGSKLYSGGSMVFTEAGGVISGALTVTGKTTFKGTESTIYSHLKGYNYDVFSHSFGNEDTFREDTGGGYTDNDIHCTWAIYAGGAARFYHIIQDLGTTTSDMRLKNVVSEDIPLSIKQIADAPTIEFKWKRRPNDPSKIGTSSQYWLDVVPAAVSVYTEESGQDILTLDYASLGVVSSIKVARHSLELEEKVKSLQEENDKLKSKLASLESRLTEIEKIIESIL